MTPESQAAETAAARIQELKDPSHADYKRLIDEAYAKIDLGACHVCGKIAWQDRAGYGFLVEPCRKCERPICENCCESDYDLQGDPGAYVCTQWECTGAARIECQQIADGNLWIEKGFATAKNDSCQRCSKKYGEPSPDCPNWREHGRLK